ncbi:NAD(P)-dependent alcohol dehydrogenase [Actinokineospora auranticolor]|uniref:NADPH:quinone reductase-like Zn-dependent oxidoreductase n=1 Tax=Actinokineospora auranticolor TaxID=155976 RepID=A0A2S6GMZ9_9PSEU|nr:NAD(P)-dependent alcohol dehydrogenase [Actinokineospora auranticolor]PPK66619.1 NADPH:quinone reductase-like Zn-dependent oxidoreductase [Actinokineospora auranticolor]
MRAIVQERYGAPQEVFHLKEIPKPEPGPGEVLLRVAASPVVGSDWHLIRGLPYLARPTTGLRRPHPVPGLEVAGTVEAVGADVRTLVVGDEVFGWCKGAFAEYATVPEGNLASKPKNLSLMHAAAVPISGFAALQAVRDAGKVSSGQRVLITGASGCVGTYAVQIAKHLGAHVTATCSAEKADLVRELGADDVVDYRSTPLDDLGPFDVFIDVYGNPPLRTCKRVLHRGGTLVLVGGTGGRWFMGTDRWLRGLLAAPFLGIRVRPLVHKDRLADLEVLRELVETEAVRPVVARTFPLPEAANAIETAASGTLTGQALLVMES